MKHFHPVIKIKKIEQLFLALIGVIYLWAIFDFYISFLILSDNPLKVYFHISVSLLRKR